MSTDAARHACSFLLARLEAEVSRLRDVAFPGHHTGPRKWLNFIGGVLDTASGYLEVASDPATPPDQASKLIKDAEKLGDNAYAFLSHVAGADATEIPHQVVAPFQRWVEQLGISNTIFFRAAHQPNYELGWLQLSNYTAINSPSKSLIDAYNAIHWPVLRVSVPGQAMGLLPHFAVVGHELGHAIQDQIKPDFKPHQQALADFLQRLQARLVASGIAFGSDVIVQINQILNSWINEIKADAVGHFVGGPAFFFAFCGYLEIIGKGYGIGPSHPPSDLRRQILVEQLSIGTPSFIDVFHDQTGLTINDEINSPHVLRCPPPDQLFQALKNLNGALKSAICVELVPYIQIVASDILSCTHNYLEKEAYP